MTTTADPACPCEACRVLRAWGEARRAHRATTLDPTSTHDAWMRSMASENAAIDAATKLADRLASAAAGTGRGEATAAELAAWLAADPARVAAFNRAPLVATGNPEADAWGREFEAAAVPSRSVARRLAAQRGEPPPRFDGQPATCPKCQGVDLAAEHGEHLRCSRCGGHGHRWERTADERTAVLVGCRDCGGGKDGGR